MQHSDITKPDMALSNAERRKRFRQFETVKHQILDADRRILARYRSSEVSGRLDDIPGVGPLTATALVASVPDPHAFKSGRDLTAWIGAMAPVAVAPADNI
ncbi:MAG: IS110 family transposase [Alphaproteobacteria bacterium]|nr:IS110 family transposase [Alphaproteobacteria bacterium]